MSFISMFFAMLSGLFWLADDEAAAIMAALFSINRAVHSAAERIKKS
jgi:hypothetical protein